MLGDSTTVHSHHITSHATHHTSDGNGVGRTYRYYATETFPYLVGCYGPGICNATGNSLQCTSNPPVSFCREGGVEWSPTPVPTPEPCRTGISDCALYDITTDPYEDENVYGRNPDVTAILEERLAYWEANSVEPSTESYSGKTSTWESAGGAVPWGGDSAEDTDKPTYTQSYSNSDAPHIVFIMADDLGINDVGYRADDCSNSEYSDNSCDASEWSSPIADALSKEGVRLYNYYVMWVCSPARSAMLTGRYPMRYGFQVGC